MKNTSLLWIGRLSLLITFLPAVFFLLGMISLGTTKTVMLIGTVLWFICAPLNQRAQS